MSSQFTERYGPWAVVAGASEGLGRAFSVALAARGLNLVVLARREAPLVSLADELEGCHGVRVVAHAMDLSRAEAAAEVAELTAEMDVGLVVYNAAASSLGRFLDVPLQAREQELDVNCRTPLLLCQHFAARLAARGRGGVLLMSSFSGVLGTALVTSYAASKAFNTTLAHSLWEELRGQGVDVLACIAGATRTPNFEATAPLDGGASARPMQPADVVEQALSALGKRPSKLAGTTQRMAFALFNALPRERAVRFMGRTMRRLYERDGWRR